MQINSILHGNSWELVNELEDESLDLIFTSPPYYKLRDYFTDDVTINGWNGQFGLEPHPKHYIEHLVNLFELLKPKLKKDGNLMVNLGDTFGGSNGKSSDTSQFNKLKETFPASIKLKDDNKSFDNYYKPKQKLLIPQRFAIAMQDNGWHCRGDWIWHKENAMPTSSKDRLNEMKEFIFHFTKNKSYYFNLDVIRIPFKEESKESKERYKRLISNKKNSTMMAKGSDSNREFHPLGKNPGDVLTFNTQSSNDKHFAIMSENIVDFCLRCGCPENGIILDPFFGSGTTGFVAKKQNKNYIGFELNPEYIEIAEKKISAVKIINNTYIIEKNDKQHLLFN